MVGSGVIANEPQAKVFSHYLSNNQGGWPRDRLPEAEGAAQNDAALTPRTNGMAERFNGRVQREVLRITIYSHRDLEILLQGFNRAYNARRPRVPGGIVPDEAVRRPIEAKPQLASRHCEPPSDSCILPKTLRVIQAAKDVSHPDTDADRRHPSA